MSALEIIRAWKDDEYRSKLSEAERALLPEHPAGLIELSDAELDAAAGGNQYTNWMLPTCDGNCITKMSGCVSVSGPCMQ